MGHLIVSKQVWFIFNSFALNEYTDIFIQTLWSIWFTYMADAIPSYIWSTPPLITVWVSMVNISRTSSPEISGEHVRTHIYNFSRKKNWNYRNRW